MFTTISCRSGPGSRKLNFTDSVSEHLVTTWLNLLRSVTQDRFRCNGSHLAPVVATSDGRMIRSRPQSSLRILEPRSEKRCAKRRAASHVALVRRATQEGAMIRRERHKCLLHIAMRHISPVPQGRAVVVSASNWPERPSEKMLRLRLFSLCREVPVPDDFHLRIST